MILQEIPPFVKGLTGKGKRFILYLDKFLNVLPWGNVRVRRTAGQRAAKETCSGVSRLHRFMPPLGGGSMAFSDTFKALADPTRREILGLLKQGELSAGEIGAHFHMTGHHFPSSRRPAPRGDHRRGETGKIYLLYLEHHGDG